MIFATMERECEFINSLCRLLSLGTENARAARLVTRVCGLEDFRKLSQVLTQEGMSMREDPSSLRKRNESERPKSVG